MKKGKMNKLFPNLKRLYIEDMLFETTLKGNVKSIEKFWKQKGFEKNIVSGKILALKKYACDKTPHLFSLIIDIQSKKKNKAILHIALSTKFTITGIPENFKALSQDIFLDFFKWLKKNRQIRLNKISLTSHCHLPLNSNLQFPPPIAAKQENPAFLVGVKYGFDKKMAIDTLIIERTKNKKKPLYFMIRTLPLFNFNEKRFNERFFDGPIDFLQKIILAFCKKRVEGGK
ncbi:hypothetical protein ACFL1I_08475 [Candidatus Omnitrophota bacterium]